MFLPSLPSPLHAMKAFSIALTAKFEVQLPPAVPLALAIAAWAPMHVRASPVTFAKMGAVPEQRLVFMQTSRM